MKTKIAAFLKTMLMLSGGFVLLLSLCNIIGLFGHLGTVGWGQLHRLLVASVFISAAHLVVSSEGLMLKLNRMRRMLLSGILALPGIGIIVYEFGLQRIAHKLIEGMNVGAASILYIASFLLSAIIIFLLCYSVEKKYVKEERNYTLALSKYKERIQMNVGGIAKEINGWS